MSLKIGLLMFFLPCFFHAGPSLAGGETGGPSLQLVCQALVVRLSEKDALQLSEKGWELGLCLKLENPASWNVVWCEEGRSCLTVDDSGGSKAPGMSCNYFADENTNEENLIWVWSRNWLPGAGAQWVRVRGSVPFAVSRQDAVTVPVTVKLVKDVAVPVVLKGAGLIGKDGKPVDVNAVLTVKECRDVDGQKLVNLELFADRMLGLRKFELQTLDGKPAVVKDERDGGIGKEWGEDRYKWKCKLKIDRVPEEEVKVVMWYAWEPRSVGAVVDSRVALSGFGKGDDGGRIQPEAEKPLECEGSAVPSAVAAGGQCKVPVRANIEILSIRPRQMKFDVRLVSDEAVGFGGLSSLGEQRLEVTDSTGRVLKPAVYDLSKLIRQKINGKHYSLVEGKCPELASPGAEWVRLKGELRVPVSRIKTSSVYELPLEKGAELHVPVPGLEQAGNDGGDVATAEGAPTCRVCLERVARGENGDATAEIRLFAEGDLFDLDEIEWVDADGNPLDARFEGGGGFSNSEGREWNRIFTIENAETIKRARIRLKYKENEEMVSVPVDMKVGLGGPVSRKEAGVAKDAKR